MSPYLKAAYTRGSLGFTLHAGTGVVHVLVRDANSGEVAKAHLAYELTGKADGPLVIVKGGISAGRHVTSSFADPSPGWWEAVVGPGLAIDTDRYRVLATDPFVAEADEAPTPGDAFTPADEACAIVSLLDALDVRVAHAFVGASYGGMVGLALAARYGDRVARLVAIGAADRAHPLATAWRSVQRDVLRWGIERGEEGRGVALARALAMTTYPGADEFLTRFSGPPDVVDGAHVFPVQRYLAARGEDFASRMDARRYEALSLAMDLHRIDPAEVTVPTTLIAATSDQLVPLSQMRALRSALRGPARLEVVDTPFGHDAFLKEPARVGAIVCAALEEDVGDRDESLGEEGAR